jgi:hypothetical protein
MGPAPGYPSCFLVPAPGTHAPSLPCVAGGMMLGALQPGPGLTSGKGYA